MPPEDPKLDAEAVAPTAHLDTGVGPTTLVEVVADDEHPATAASAPTINAPAGRPITAVNQAIALPRDTSTEVGRSTMIGWCPALSYHDHRAPASLARRLV
ncbi:MAG TPA: hypothetical protein VH482_29175, partial [Thermomicrobiales bacterium]